MQLLKKITRPKPLEDNVIIEPKNIEKIQLIYDELKENQILRESILKGLNDSKKKETG